MARRPMTGSTVAAIISSAACCSSRSTESATRKHKRERLIWAIARPGTARWASEVGADGAGTAAPEFGDRSHLRDGGALIPLGCQCGYWGRSSYPWTADR